MYMVCYVVLGPKQRSNDCMTHGRIIPNIAQQLLWVGLGMLLVAAT